MDAGFPAGIGNAFRLRAPILHDPPILILDEATSSVDGETESKIQEGIARLVRGRTVIEIAHRLATLRNVNRLLVMENGRMVEQGSHSDLLGCDGIYAKLVCIQANGLFIDADMVGA
jgi:ABC-type multidrug transport system fused ATPase/permease subunit